MVRDEECAYDRVSNGLIQCLVLGIGLRSPAKYRLFPAPAAKNATKNAMGPKAAHGVASFDTDLPLNGQWKMRFRGRNRRTTARVVVVVVIRVDNHRVDRNHAGGIVTVPVRAPIMHVAISAMTVATMTVTTAMVSTVMPVSAVMSMVGHRHRGRHAESNDRDGC